MLLNLNTKNRRWQTQIQLPMSCVQCSRLSTLHTAWFLNLVVRMDHEQ
jgi:hypothetical protein